MLTIYGRTNSINVQKVMWTVGELGLDHERIDAGGVFGGLDTDEYGQMNPNRRIPVLRDGDTVVWESHSCVRYLAARYGSGALWPEDPGARSLSDRWMDWKATTLQPFLHTVFWGLVRTPADQRDDAAIARAAREIGPVWRILDNHLADSRYVAGAHLTMGDIPLGCAWWRYSNLELDRQSFPNINLWYQNLKGKEAYRRHVMIDVT
ncbi:MAG: glutathione S-transferase N-terminal domain-containing protein [Geminicoccaceae bacterium]|nr:glutathione S-transferase N-terminal domain-containing protein [Geminicoccaceae bacterium]